jgi:hypothetical protein
MGVAKVIKHTSWSRDHNVGFLTQLDLLHLKRKGQSLMMINLFAHLPITEANERTCAAYQQTTQKDFICHKFLKHMRLTRRKFNHAQKEQKRTCLVLNAANDDITADVGELREGLNHGVRLHRELPGRCQDQHARGGHALGPMQEALEEGQREGRRLAGPGA